METAWITQKFLFVHDLIREDFGGFRIVITKEDIKKFENKKQNKNIYKSEVFNNDKDLFCSCKLIINNNTVNKERQINRRRFPGHMSSHTTLTQYSVIGISEFIGENENDKNEVNNNEGIRNNISCKMFIHQLNDDTKIEMISAEIQEYCYKFIELGQ